MPPCAQQKDLVAWRLVELLHSFYKLYRTLLSSISTKANLVVSAESCSDSVILDYVKFTKGGWSALIGFADTKMGLVDSW